MSAKFLGIPRKNFVIVTVRGFFVNGIRVLGIWNQGSGNNVSNKTCIGGGWGLKIAVRKMFWLRAIGKREKNGETADRITVCRVFPSGGEGG